MNYKKGLTVPMQKFGFKNQEQEARGRGERTVMWYQGPKISIQCVEDHKI